MTEGTVMLYLHDTQTLHKLIENLMKIKEIIKSYPNRPVQRIMPSEESGHL
ncbi:MAG: hypothetical protein MZV63_17000 [Marinilabiliales bacterium]|nr:hypothetical protein [Marinilabiliales bacterium]